MDSPDRAQYLQRVCQTDQLDVLESNHSALFSYLMKQSASIPLPCGDGKDYSFAALMRYQALFILEAIQGSTEKDEGKLRELLAVWDEQLRYSPSLKLSQVVSNLIKNQVPAGECMDILRAGYVEFRQDITQSGINDPALATLDSFISNYAYVVSGFNGLWGRFAEFYVKNILRIRPLPIRPDRTWLMLTKREDSHDVLIPEHTAFIAGTDEKGTDLCYYSTEPVMATGMKLHAVSSVLFQQNVLVVNGKKLQYVQTILQKMIQPNEQKQPVVLFDTNAHRDDVHTFIPTGLMIESPLFVLEEGYREVMLRLYLTPESVTFFQRYAEDLTNRADRTKDIYYRLLKDTFYLEISTAGEWRHIPSYELKYHAESGQEHFCISFLLPYDYPAPVPCEEEAHGMNTQWPSLRILINRDAPIFPYTWARQLFIHRLSIENDVRDVTSLEVINEQGRQNTDASFYPFGVQGDKGAWMIAGNYEAAIKPLTEVRLTCQWLQLPHEVGGFASYYKDYEQSIDNTSFRVKTEYLKEKTWVESSPVRSNLFAVHATTRTLIPESSLSWNLQKQMPAYAHDRADFTYGKVPSGFIRMSLDAPDTGFGHSLYQRLFINSLLKRGNKEEVKLIPSPYVPMLDGLTLHYKAEETIQFGTGYAQGKTRLYHIDPITKKNIQPIQKGTFTLVNGPEEEGYLKFAFSDIIGYQTIRLHAELLPSHHEFEKSDLLPIKWYYHNGLQWIRLAEEAFLQDTTDHFLNSGVIEIQLPARITEAQLDGDGLFWLYAAFERNSLNYPSVFGFFLNTVEVAARPDDQAENAWGTQRLPAGTINRFQKELPGIQSVSQLRPSLGGLEPESLQRMIFRASNQALFRQKPVTPEDYERMVLERFPQVDKVTCFPACDTKNDGRKGVVTLAVMQKKPDMLLPLCPYDLLFEIEQEISHHTAPFVLVDAINPVFEEVMIRCHVTLKPGIRQNLFQRDIKRRLDQYIAPWMGTDDLPSFGHSIRVADVQALLESCPEADKVNHVSILVLMTSTQKATLGNAKVQKLLEFTDQKAWVPIHPSHPWYIQIPAAEHLVFTGSETEYAERIGTGELEISNTFIIKD